MAIWLVRAGKTGSRESIALQENCVLIGFQELGDLSDVKDRDELRDRLATANPSMSKGAISNYRGQVWAFLDRIKEGDIVVLPLKSTSTIALGKVTGDYTYHPEVPADVRHRRSVEWIREDISRSVFGQDLLYSFGAFMTVCQITRNNAEERVKAVLAGKEDPGILATTGIESDEEDVSEADTTSIDIESYAKDGIAALVTEKYAGHQLSDLVSEILKAQGYHTAASPPGADGGVDILVGGGPMGFDEPRICVQVKTGEADGPTLRDLQGTVQNFGADYGLLVAWRGFKKGVRAEARRSFFKIRLWDADSVITQLTSVYDRLPAAIRDELPLTQFWSVVESDETRS